MEIAIPFIALAGAYVISNQNNNKNHGRVENRQYREQYKEQNNNREQNNNNIEQNNNREQNNNNREQYKEQNNNNREQNKNKEQNQYKEPKEEFTNMGNRYQLPNTDIPSQNYPITNLNELKDTIQSYPNPNTATDKYFDQNLYENSDISGKKVTNNIKEVYSLTGDYLKTEEFKHNNMVPFYGGKFKGDVYGVNMAETILDNMSGTGSQVIKKIEQAPLFKPENNIQWANGTPNMSDFFQSRVNPGMNNSMVKPFESEHVGPGLGVGYTTDGSGGYNSGMELRDSWLPKTVDELRVSTNPKMEYSLENHQGPSYSHVQNRGILGKVEKYNPDGFFINTQDRWLTTTGQEKAQALRPIEEIHDTSRTTTSVSYTGVAGPGDRNASYVPGSYVEPKRNVLENYDIASSYACGKGPTNNNEKQQSFTNYKNNRSTTIQPETHRSLFKGTVGALLNPIINVIRPTRKEEFTSNIRIYGDASQNSKQHYVFNPNDVPATTIKETTMYQPDSYINNQSSTGQVLHNQQAINNQRDTTTVSYIGTVGGTGAVNQGEVIVDSAYRQYNNELKEPAQKSFTNHGSNQIFNQSVNMSIAKIDSDRDNPRMWVPNAATIGQIPISKEKYGHVKSKQHYDEAKIGVDRIQPDLLNAFRENPYTHSLTDSV
jgi:hypothetical protein